MSETRDFLRLNVGFIIHETIGFSRDFPFEIATIHLPPDLNLKDLRGNVRVSRTAQGLLVQARMNATVETECGRCLTTFDQTLEVDFTDLYAFTLKTVTESGLLVPENGKIDLTAVLREEMLLAIPINPICKQDCKGLCPICGEDLNETTCNHDQDDIDPRLSALKSLLQ